MLNVITREHGSALVVAVGGRVDSANAADFQEALGAVKRSKGW